MTRSATAPSASRTRREVLVALAGRQHEEHADRDSGVTTLCASIGTRSHAPGASHAERQRESPVEQPASWISTPGHPPLRLRQPFLDLILDAVPATVPGTPEGPAAPAPPVTRLPSSTLTNTKAPPTATVGHQTLPRRSGPSAVFDWAELRLSRGAAYSYYFLVDKLRCLNHATHVRIVALGHAHRVPCGRRRGFASGPLPAGTDYRVSAQALRIRRGRIIRRGSVVLTLLHMRAADDGWVPITKLPGTPPKV